MPLTALAIPAGFQPTRPLRGATQAAMTFSIALIDFNPRAPCGARQQKPQENLQPEQFQPTRPLRGATGELFSLPLADYHISTHAPLAGRDVSSVHFSARTRNFNPRAPCGARLIFIFFYSFFCNISTHAPLAGRDGREHRERPGAGNFNPRAPCGARPFSRVLLLCPKPFQPTRPLRGATATVLCAEHRVDISTHAPLAGRDLGAGAPYGLEYNISTHAPLAGRDNPSIEVRLTDSEISTHAPLAGRDR